MCSSIPSHNYQNYKLSAAFRGVEKNLNLQKTVKYSQRITEKMLDLQRKLLSIAMSIRNGNIKTVILEYLKAITPQLLPVVHKKLRLVKNSRKFLTNRNSPNNNKSCFNINS